MKEGCEPIAMGQKLESNKGIEGERFRESKIRCGLERRMYGLTE